eukprot:3736355-Pyramimonas_sp.AAC.1
MSATGESGGFGRASGPSCCFPPTGKRSTSASPQPIDRSPSGSTGKLCSATIFFDGAITPLALNEPLKPTGLGLSAEPRGRHLQAHEPVQEWTVSGGRSENDHPHGVVLDDEGNSYLSGNYRVVRTYGQVPPPSNDDIFVAKVCVRCAFLLHHVAQRCRNYVYPSCFEPSSVNPKL